MRTFHIYLSMFFFPVFLLYILTGLMFFLGFNSRNVVLEKKIEINWPSDESARRQIAEEFLKNSGVNQRPPERFRSDETSFFWGSSGSVGLSMSLQSQEEGIVAVKIYKPTIYGRLMALHANRGQGDAFQILGAMFCLAWLGSYFGLCLRFKKLKLKRPGLYLGTGFLCTVAACLLSW